MTRGVSSRARQPRDVLSPAVALPDELVPAVVRAAREVEHLGWSSWCGHAPPWSLCVQHPRSGRRCSSCLAVHLGRQHRDAHVAVLWWPAWFTHVGKGRHPNSFVSASVRLVASITAADVDGLVACGRSLSPREGRVPVVWGSRHTEAEEHVRDFGRP